MKFFVTGTGTGVGKTFVTSAIARMARDQGLRVFAFKPIETGCTALGDDQELLAEAAGNWQQGHLRGVYRFALPAAPLVAAEAEGKTIDLDRVQAAIDEGSRDADLTLVEGAGGWRVPITEDVDMAAWARRLGYPVIIVATATLGTINHTLLTVEAVQRDGCHAVAVILSARPGDLDAERNKHEIGRRTTVRVHVTGGATDILSFIVQR